MPVVKCASCGRNLNVESRKMGVAIACPKCKGQVFGPQSAAAELSPEEQEHLAAIRTENAVASSSVPSHDPIIDSSDRDLIDSVDDDSIDSADDMAVLIAIQRKSLTHLVEIERMVRLFYNIFVIQLVIGALVVLVMVVKMLGS